MSAAIVAATVSLSAVSWATEVHRWYDTEGRVHYSDTKPLDVDTILVTIDLPNDFSAGATLIERADPGSQDDPLIASEEMLIAELIGPCTQARQQFTVLHEQMPVYLTEDGIFRPDWAADTYRGKRAYLPDEDRGTAIRRARNRVLEHCSDPDDVRAEVLAYNEWVEAEFCKVATVRLAAIEQPDSRTSESEISRQRALVEAQCN